MALTDQPYMPLYVDDWMNNNKLKMCSAGAHGLMVSIMCLMHKSEEYGTLLLRQRFHQTDQPLRNFAALIAKLTSFDLPETEKYFKELIDENILKIDGEKLICKRMVKDAITSKNRSSNGKKGAEVTNLKTKHFAAAKSTANSVIEYVNVNEDEIDNEKEGMGGKNIPPSINQVIAYCQERQNTVDPEVFLDFYSSKNWMIGKNKMKNWQACVRTWEKNRSANVTPAAGQEKLIGRQTQETYLTNLNNFTNGL